MKLRTGRFALSALVRLVACVAVFTQLSAASLAQDDTAEEVVFVPPVFGAPGNRVGAASRNTLSGTELVTIVAPQGGGLTIRQSPVLYWWLREDTNATLTMRLRRHEDARPLLLVEKTVSLSKGLQAWNLGSLGVRLANDRIYQWSVTVDDSDGGEVASAASFVERQTLRALSGSESPETSALAKNGVWYDAFASAVMSGPSGQEIDALLDQAELVLPGR